MDVFTKEMRGKLVPYAGPPGETTALGAPILVCPTCSGTGRVVKDDELADAWRRPQDLQQTSVTAMLAFLQGEGQVLRLLPDEQQQALELAEKLGNFITSGVLTFDEKAVRGDFLWRLRELKAKQGSRLSWETLRRVTVKLYPPLRDDFSYWRALRMACQHAQPSKEGVYITRLSYRKGQGFTHKREPAESVHIASPADFDEAMHTFVVEQDVRLLGRRLFNLRQKLFTSMRRGALDPVDSRILSLAHAFLNEAIRLRAAGTRNASVVCRCEQLLRIVRSADVEQAGEA